MTCNLTALAEGDDEDGVRVVAIEENRVLVRTRREETWLTLAASDDFEIKEAN